MSPEDDEVITMEPMTDQQQSAPVTLLPVLDETKNLLGGQASSCCGGSACGTSD